MRTRGSRYRRGVNIRGAEAFSFDSVGVGVPVFSIKISESSFLEDSFFMRALWLGR